VLLHSPRLLSGICCRDILDGLQGISDGAPARPRFRVEDWYRPHLGTFLCVNKDGVLCHVECSSTLYNKGQGVPPSVSGQPPGMGSVTEGNAGIGSAVPVEFLVYNDLMGEIGGAGIFWPNHAQDPNSRQRASQTPDTTDGSVSSCCPTPQF
jgi:hypothetical protein